MVVTPVEHSFHRSLPSTFCADDNHSLTFSASNSSARAPGCCGRWLTDRLHAGPPLSLRSTPTKLPRPPLPPDQADSQQQEDSDVLANTRIPRTSGTHTQYVQPSPETSPTALPRPFRSALSHNLGSSTGAARTSIYAPNVAPGDEEDEFSYALNGGERTEPFTHARFSPKAPPVHLVTDVAAPLPAVVEATIEDGEEPVSMSGSDAPSHHDIEHGASMKAPRIEEPVQAPLVLRRRVGRIDEERVMDGADQQAAALAAAQASAISALPISRLVHSALTNPAGEANASLRAATAAAAAEGGWGGSEAPLSATEEALRHLMPPEGVPMSFDSTTVDSASAVFAPISGQSDVRPRSNDGPMSSYRLNGVLSSTGRRLGSTGMQIRTPRSLGPGPLSAMSAVGPQDSADMTGASIGTCGDSSVFHQQTQVEFTNATNTHDGAPTSIGGGIVAYSYTTTTVPEAWSQSQVSYATGSVAMSTLAPRGAAALQRQFALPESSSGGTGVVREQKSWEPPPADAPHAPQPLADSRSSSATVVAPPAKGSAGGGYDAARDGGVSASSSGIASAGQHGAASGSGSRDSGGDGKSSRRVSPGREASPEEWLENFTDLRAVHNVPQELTQAPGGFKDFRKGYANHYAETSAEVHAAKAALARPPATAAAAPAGTAPDGSGDVAPRQSSAQTPLLEVEEQGSSDRVAVNGKSGGVPTGMHPVKATPSAASGTSEQSLGAVGSSVGGLGGAGAAGASGIGSRRCDANALQGLDIYNTVGSNISAHEAGLAAGRLMDSAARRSQVGEEADVLSPGSLAQCKEAAHEILVSQARVAPLDLEVWRWRRAVPVSFARASIGHKLLIVVHRSCDAHL